MSHIKAQAAPGLHIERMLVATANAKVGPDGSPVIAASIYTTAPADKRPLRAFSLALNEGQPLRYIDPTFAQGVLATPDGRPVFAYLKTDSAGANTP